MYGCKTDVLLTADELYSRKTSSGFTGLLHRSDEQQAT